MATAEAVAKTAGIVVDEREKIFSRRLMCLDVYRGLMVAGMIVKV
jgi:predicted acyltransferase